MIIQLFKLVSGEEIIAKVVSENETTYLVSDVRTLVMQPTGPGQMGIALVPWVATMADQELPLKKTHVMVENKNVPKQLEDGYLQETTGIQLASGKI